MIAAGVDIGGSFIKAGLVDTANGRIKARCSVPFPKGQGEEAVWDLVDASVKKLLRSQKMDPADLGFVGVALPGTLSPDKTTVIHAYNLNFHGTLVYRPLQERFPHTPLAVMNDGDAATVAEHQFGVLKGARTAVLLTLGTGVGGGLILNGKLFGGGLGNGVEPGHMTLRYDGEPHICGNNGCVEMYCGAHGLATEKPEATPREIIEGIRRGDAESEKVLDRYTDALSSALVSIVNLLDPEVIALGGGISNAGAPLIDMTARKVREKSFFVAERRIVRASMGNDAGIVGAAVAGDCL
ncbi:MAG: ROK family protein [Bacillota bacterium]|jgi:glucokinase|nr:ROK family protein [Eubacteriales bacterium]MDD3537747.1 ROK family protein [Eubacteriales bacterium]MDD4285670.1 ROK family protein [Eubacteriales bacterium]MDI9491973.1 ROK family protein [Bacillota bacterium]NLV69389.1 ROK family protein [Clostridiales bacterium]